MLVEVKSCFKIGVLLREGVCLKREQFLQMIINDYKLFGNCQRCPNEFGLEDTCSVDINNMNCEECWRLALEKLE